MSALPERLDDTMLARVEAYAAAPLPSLPRTDDQHMLQFLRVLSTMPRQQADDVTAELRVEMMMRLLGHLPRVTLDWMAEEALRRFTFHPSVKELLDLAKEWTRGDDSIRARSRAEFLARRERQARLDDARRALRLGNLDQDAIDALDERIKRICEGEGLLWRCDCGSYVARPQLEMSGAGLADTGEALSRLKVRFTSTREASHA